MWKIYEHKNALKELELLPIDIVKRYEKWKDIVAISGPIGLRQIKGFNDESLHGEWKGYRSSRLNIQYRIIYKIENEQFFVKVIKVTAHDYRRK
ncbi:MAG: type II toxin-antitoxin system mRNA interferase toxin, RelE/StbE family [Candidatus Riflebacteria bacterium]|nr:type II toxin-antitoxin system mRNA interferase toxin, RelE/StbE family [Candidatus Riflebacteria bacterium]